LVVASVRCGRDFRATTAPAAARLIAARLSALPPCRRAVAGNEQMVALYDVMVEGRKVSANSGDVAVDGGNHAARLRR